MSSPEAGIPPPARTVTAVPEPSTYVLLAIAGGIAALARRRG